MGYKEYIGVRILNSILVLIAVTLIAYGLFIGMGNPVEKLRQQLMVTALQQGTYGANASEISAIVDQKIRQLEAAFGLDKPVYIQVGIWIWNSLTLNFPRTWFYKPGSDVKVLIMERLPNTILLIGTSTLMTIIVGISLGLKAAIKHGSMLDKSVIISGLVGYSFASWWVGMVLLFVAKSIIGIRFSLGSIMIQSFSEIFTNPDVGYRFILAIIALTLVTFGSWALIVRNITVSYTHLTLPTTERV